MPIKFITLSKEFAEEMRKRSEYEVHVMRIENYQEEKGHHTYYVSPANSLGWMDGGIDESFSKMFPEIGVKVREKIQQHGVKYHKKGCSNAKFLPIGSSIIIRIDKERSLVSAPTMLVPEDVSRTMNAYYATRSLLYNIFYNDNISYTAEVWSDKDWDNVSKRRKIKMCDKDILLTSMCCGCGKMKVKEAVSQILEAISDYKQLTPEHKQSKVVIDDAGGHYQPANKETRHMHRASQQRQAQLNRRKSC